MKASEQLVSALLENEAEQPASIKFVVQKSWQGGPWVDEIGYSDGKAYDNRQTAIGMAETLFDHLVKYNLIADMKFRIIRRVVTTQETEIKST